MEMDHDVILNVYPSTTDGLAWSDDCEIAIGADDHVQILIPRLSAKNIETSSHSLWYATLSVRTNQFTSKEIHLEVPTSFATFSAGEELSTSHVVALKWSPPGLDVRKRCCLAVLTSNLVLSLWTSKKELRTTSSNWQRVLVVNKAIGRYYQDLHPDDAVKIKGERSEKWKRFERTRAFAWAPPLEVSSTNETKHLLAVANDEMHVIFVEIKRRKSAGDSVVFSAQAIHRWEIGKTNPVPRPELNWTLQTYMNNPCYVRQMTWSRWHKTNTDERFALFAYDTHDHIIVRRVIVSNVSRGMALVDEQKHFRYDISPTGSLNGPLRFVDHGPSEVLLVAGIHNEIICIQMNINTLETATVFRRSRKEWSEVSGLTVTCNSYTGMTLHVTPHNGLSNDTEVRFRLPDLQSLVRQSNVWQEMALKSRAQYAKENNLEGKAKTQVWGMEASPIGDFLAVVITFIPSHTPSYIMNMDRRCRVLVKLPEQLTEQPFTFPNRLTLDRPEDINFSALAFSIRSRLVEVPKAAHECLTVDDVLEGLLPLGMTEAPENSMDVDFANSSLKNDDIIQYTNERVHEVMASPGANLWRLRAMVSTLLKINNKALPTTSPILQLVSSIIKQTSGTLAFDNVSQKLVGAYQMFDLKSTTQDFDTEDSLFQEDCEICDAPIPFEHLDEATCQRGHRLLRCGLSLLCIQSPEISKFCGICSTTFLDERHFPKMVSTAEQASGQAASPRKSLATIIFEACDTCVYCGGKFIG